MHIAMEVGMLYLSNKYPKFHKQCPSLQPYPIQVPAQELLFPGQRRLSTARVPE